MYCIAFFNPVRLKNLSSELTQKIFTGKAGEGHAKYIVVWFTNHLLTSVCSAEIHIEHPLQVKPHLSTVDNTDSQISSMLLSAQFFFYSNNRYYSQSEAS